MERETFLDGTPTGVTALGFAEGILDMKSDDARPQSAPVSRILVVDDEEDLLRGNCRWLTSAGYRVEGVGDGAQAAARFKAEAFDLVLSDISMPNMTGIDLLRAVREQDLDVPVILMTGNPGVDSASRAIELGAFRYLIKPVDPSELLQVVQMALRMCQMAKLKREALTYLEHHGKQIGDLAGLEVHFANALKNLWMAYQPIVSWSGRRIFAHEALLRTTEPKLPHPGALLDAAERLGKLTHLGRAVRDSVALSAVHAPNSALLFVNLHTRDLLDDSLFSSDSPLSAIAERVVLEITERTALDEVSDVRTRVTALRQLGFRIAIDDLGAGYAGLTSFAQLEPEVVKLDMSLVRNVHAEPFKQKLIGSIVELSSDMGIQVIAEGVETIQERDALVGLGCDLLQGYLFAKPGKPFPEPTF
jgi:EAL domain-containing protein (putative c-di-GMP-specific phosphodiesterase class I)